MHEGPITGKGFQDRGKGTTFRNCTAIDCSGGAFDLNGHAHDHGYHVTTLQNCEIKQTYFNQYDVSINVDSEAGVSNGIIKIVGLVADDVERVLEIKADGAPVHMVSPCISGIRSGGALARLNTGTKLYVTGAVMDFSDGGGGDCVEMEGTSECHINGMTIIADGAGNPGEVFKDAGGTGTHTYSANNITAIGGTVSLDDGSGTFTTQNNTVA
jgi:hypothetical protein